MTAELCAGETSIRVRLPVDLRLTLGPLRHGKRDPCMLVDAAGSWWRATRTPLGPATACYQSVPGEAAVRVRAWGPGAAWCLDAAPELLGAGDSLDGFAPQGLVRQLHRRLRGLRISRSQAVLEALVPSVLGQRVTAAEAVRSYRDVVRAWGEPAPGPLPLRLPPAPAALAAAPYWAMHRMGVERRRADTIRYAAARARRVEEAAGMTIPDAHRRLRALPGVGAWTSAEVAIVALGDADAVSVGDYHLPHAVSWALAGEPRGSDERMLELLAPFAGHRGRVARLITSAGLYAPRFGPGLPRRDIRHH